MIVQRPLVVYDGVMTLCTILDQAYVPEESISLEELVSLLKDGLSSQKSPEYQPAARRISRKEPQTGGPIPYKAFYKNSTRSDGETDSDEQLTKSFSPTKRKTSSVSSLPNSVILPLRSDTLELADENLDDVFIAEKSSWLKERLVDQINWVMTQGDDCVALETLSSISEIVTLVKVFLRSKTPAALEFKVNHNETVTVSYQFLHDFKNDFMMLKVHDKYCMFMSPF